TKPQTVPPERSTMIGQISLDGRALRGVKSATCRLNSARPTAMAIEVVRDPGLDPHAFLFALTTNRNWTERKFSGSVQLQDALGAATYTVDFENASAESYATRGFPDVNKPGLETIVLIAPKFTVHADGNVVPFESRERRHLPGQQ